MARHLLSAEAGGVPSLGLGRVPWIREQIADGRPAADRSLARETRPTQVLVDGHGSLGYVAVDRGLARAAVAARKWGVSVLMVRDVFLTGALRVYASDVAAEGLACIMTSAAAPAVLMPPGGRTPVLGTNPMAFGIPDATGATLVFDTSASEIPFSVVRGSAATGRPLPDGVAIGADGNPTTDAQRVLDGGGLLPWAGHRGFGFAAVVAAMGMLAGSLTEPRDLADCGLVAVLIDTRSTGPQASTLDDLRRAVRDSVGEGGRLPGDAWAQKIADAQRDGFRVADDTWAHLLD